MDEVRCGQCGKKLAMGTFTRLAIKCTRCKALNDLRATSSTPECPSASELGATFGEQSHHSLAGRQTPPG